MEILDLYSCEGVGALGYIKYGNVTGVDIIDHSKVYPGQFVKSDALEYLIKYGQNYDFIHASPPCQEFSVSSMQFRLNGKSYPNLIAATRDALIKIGKPYVIENVPGSPLIDPVLLCGAMFNIPTYRHRLFETNFVLKQPFHPIHIKPNAKMGRSVKEGEFIQYVGHFSGVQYVRNFTGAQHASQYGLAQSIPPQYTEYIINQYLTKQP